MGWIKSIKASDRHPKSRVNRPTGLTYGCLAFLMVHRSGTVELAACSKIRHVVLTVLNIIIIIIIIRIIRTNF